MKFNQCLPKAIFDLLRITFICMAIIAFDACAMSYISLNIMPDPIEPPDEEEVNIWEERAKAGNWDLKEQFAAAYLYETLFPKDFNRGCNQLIHGHRCRMMAQRKEVGRQFLKEILDAESSNKSTSSSRQASYQENYALYSLFAAAPDYQPDSFYYKEALFYFEKSILNGYRNCSAARSLLNMVRYGKCIPKGDTRFDKYKSISQLCPTI